MSSAHAAPSLQTPCVTRQRTGRLRFRALYAADWIKSLRTRTAKAPSSRR